MKDYQEVKAEQFSAAAVPPQPTEKDKFPTAWHCQISRRESTADIVPALHVTSTFPQNVCAILFHAPERKTGVFTYGQFHWWNGSGVPAPKSSRRAILTPLFQWNTIHLPGTATLLPSMLCGVG